MKCTSEKALLEEFKREFRFSNYFGYNFDALDECLNDLSWLPSKRGYMIFISSSELALREVQQALIDLLEIFKSTAEEWHNGRNYDDFPTLPTLFKVVFHFSVKPTGSKFNLFKETLERVESIN